MFYKLIVGYTAQARWYAAHLEDPTTGEWISAGWTKLGNGAVKPVFTMPATGVHVVILGGKSHLHAAVSEVPAGHVFATEDLAHAVQGGW